MLHKLPVVMLLAHHELVSAADSGLAEVQCLVKFQVKSQSQSPMYSRAHALDYLLEPRSIKPHDTSLFSTTLYVQGH